MSILQSLFIHDCASAFCKFKCLNNLLVRFLIYDLSQFTFPSSRQRSLSRLPFLFLPRWTIDESGQIPSASRSNARNKGSCVTALATYASWRAVWVLLKKLEKTNVSQHPVGSEPRVSTTMAVSLSPFEHAILSISCSFFFSWKSSYTVYVSRSREKDAMRGWLLQMIYPRWCNSIDGEKIGDRSLGETFRRKLQRFEDCKLGGHSWRRL